MCPLRAFNLATLWTVKQMQRQLGAGVLPAGGSGFSPPGVPGFSPAIQLQFSLLKFNAATGYTEKKRARGEPRMTFKHANTRRPADPAPP